MSKTTEQMLKWIGLFGKEYTDRNFLTLEEVDALYKRNYGVTRTELNERLLQGIDCSVQTLEVGSNIGNQLLCLQSMGFSNLYGLELQSYAIELSKARMHNINMIQGSVFNIPFKNGCFDLVFTSGVLIHLSPSDVAHAMKEIYRCTKEYIWGFEYYASEYTEVTYRGNENLLWKADFPRLYLELFDDLELVKEKRLKYLNSDDGDSMFLIRKK